MTSSRNVPENLSAHVSLTLVLQPSADQLTSSPTNHHPIPLNINELKTHPHPRDSFTRLILFFPERVTHRKSQVSSVALVALLTRRPLFSPDADARLPLTGHEVHHVS